MTETVPKSFDHVEGGRGTGDGGGGMGTERRKTLHGRFGDSSKKPRVYMGLGGKDAGTIGDLQCSRPALSCSPPLSMGQGTPKDHAQALQVTSHTD